jgi:hypothetical protein
MALSTVRKKFIAMPSCGAAASMPPPTLLSNKRRKTAMVCDDPDREQA